MPNEYSIEIHNYISEQIMVHEQKVRQTAASEYTTTEHYSLGRLKELQWIRHYLADNIDLKEFTYY